MTVLTKDRNRVVLHGHPATGYIKASPARSASWTTVKVERYGGLTGSAYTPPTWRVASFDEVKLLSSSSSTCEVIKAMMETIYNTPQLFVAVKCIEGDILVVAPVYGTADSLTICRISPTKAASRVRANPLYNANSYWHFSSHYTCSNGVLTEV